MKDKPLYQQLMSLYIDKITGGELSPGSPLPSEAQMTELHGISNITARRVLNELKREGYVIREKGRGTYVAEHSEPLPGSMKVISLILARDDAWSKSMEMVAEISGRLGAMGYYLSIHISHDDVRSEEAFIRKSVRDGVEGMILYGATSSSNAQLLIELGVRGYPLVMLDRRFDGFPLPSVTSDNVGGAAAITRYLIERGHRKICFVSNFSIAETSSIRERYRGFMEALYSANLQEEFGGYFLIPNSLFERHRTEGKKEKDLRRLLTGIQERGITAVVCLSDPVAFQLMASLEQEGISVPEQVSVAGFDNLEDSARSLVPLTTVNQDFSSIARIALDALLVQLEGRVPEPLHTIVPTTIVERKSVADLREKQ
ncbi:MAG: substrate-binding domain-containing protein [Oscillospiraceae bacterium]